MTYDIRYMIYDIRYAIYDIRYAILIQYTFNKAKRKDEIKGEALSVKLIEKREPIVSIVLHRLYDWGGG